MRRTAALVALTTLAACGTAHPAPSLDGGALDAPAAPDAGSRDSGQTDAASPDARPGPPDASSDAGATDDLVMLCAGLCVDSFCGVPWDDADCEPTCQERLADCSAEERAALSDCIAVCDMRYPCIAAVSCSFE